MLSSSQCHHGAYLFPNEIIKDQPNLFLLFFLKRERDEGGGAHVASCSDSCIYVLHGRCPATTSFRPFRSIQFTATRRSAGPLTCGTWRTSHSTVSTGSAASAARGARHIRRFHGFRSVPVYLQPEENGKKII
jgi:hypothetical protein